jgi:hypothetical protein
MCPVPATNVKGQVVRGATMVTYFGFARITALRDAHQEIDSAGGVHHGGGHDDRQDDQDHVDRGRGGRHPERDDEDQEPNRAPRARDRRRSTAKPIQMAASTTTNCSTMDSVIGLPWIGMRVVELTARTSG